MKPKDDNVSIVIDQIMVVIPEGVHHTQKTPDSSSGGQALSDLDMFILYFNKCLVKNKMAV